MFIKKCVFFSSFLLSLTLAATLSSHQHGLGDYNIQTMPTYISEFIRGDFHPNQQPAMQNQEEAGHAENQEFPSPYQYQQQYHNFDESLFLSSLPPVEEFAANLFSPQSQIGYKEKEKNYLATNINIKRVDKHPTSFQEVKYIPPFRDESTILTQINQPEQAQSRLVGTHDQNQNLKTNQVVSTKFLYQFDFQIPKILSETKFNAQKIDGFSPPIQINPGSALTSRLTSQYVTISEQSVPFIERTVELKEGLYKIMFEWESQLKQQRRSNLNVFWNHFLIGSFYNEDSLAKTQRIDIRVTKECEPVNHLKFTVKGKGEIGLDNIRILQ